MDGATIRLWLPEIHQKKFVEDQGRLLMQEDVFEEDEPEFAVMEEPKQKVSALGANTAPKKKMNFYRWTLMLLLFFALLTVIFLAGHVQVR